ncbi:MAG: winged helix-turn-helix transcriptional regulator [Verrucomicrobia bacterium]|nr:winged helix-turn-helix transcriptional regulator [Verrucomicrobiota bacterium]
MASPIPIDSPERRRLPPTLRRAWYGLNQAFRRRIARLSLTPDQFTALRVLKESDSAGIPQRQLADLMSSDPNTVASLLERMERAGWVQRRPHELDRRAYRIKLLPAGQKTYQIARAAAIALQTEVLEALPESARETFLTHLAIIADACRKAAEEAPRESSFRSTPPPA